jgi:molecular chaperone GrpE
MMTPMNDSEDAFESEFVDEEEAELTPASVKRLREKLKKAVEEKQEYLDGWQRARADFVNYKKEEANMHTDRLDRLRSGFVEELLPALDALELVWQKS